MKNRKFTLLSLILVCCSINASAVEYEFVAGDSSKETQVCVAAGADDTKMLKKELRWISQYRTAVSLRAIVNSIQCNDLYLGHFAKRYNAQSTSAFLNKYTNTRNKKLLEKITIKDIASEQGTDQEKVTIVLVSSN